MKKIYEHFKKMKKRNLIAFLLIIPVTIVSIGYLSAFLTDKKSLDNAFVIGDVKIELNEPKWSALTDTDKDGIPDVAEKVLPNDTITKDPSIKNIGTNEAYVYLEVIIPTKSVITVDNNGNKLNNGQAVTTELYSFTPNSGWTQINKTSGTNTVTYVYGYSTKLAKNVSTSTLFDNVKFANVISNQGVEGQEYHVVVNAYAIQTANTGTLQNAWTLVSNQTK